MNKNVEQMKDKVFVAVVLPFKGKGEEKLILHEATIGKDGEVSYGAGNTVIIDPSAVTRLDREEPMDSGK